MKIRSPITLSDADKARVAKLAQWLPRISVTMPVHTPKVNKKKVKSYPY